MLAENITKTGRDILIRNAPEWLHEKLERYIALRRVKGEKLTKPAACTELLNKAISKIK